MKRSRVNRVAFALAVVFFPLALGLSIDKGADVAGSWLTVLWTAFAVAFIIGILSLDVVWSGVRGIAARLQGHGHEAEEASSPTPVSPPASPTGDTGEGQTGARVLPRSQARSLPQPERDEVPALPDRPARVDLVQEVRALLRRADAFNEENRVPPIQRETLRSALQPLFARGREIALAAELAEAGDRYAHVKALREWTDSVEDTLERERFEEAISFVLYTDSPPPSLQERSGNNLIGAFLDAMRSDAVQRRELQQLATERVQRLHALIEVLRDQADSAGSGVDRAQS